ncbi:hypothetical protein GLW20_03860 [Virgibacillus halodenitrificans]|nr:hypothetical protein [Virgibacillus halodenitrificans]
MARKSNSEKEAILIESFDVLKDNIEEHGNKITDIIGKVSAINLDLAVEMWKYVLQNANSLIKEDGYRYTGGVIYNIEEKLGNEKVVNILKENDEIVEVCFGLSNDIYYFIVSEAIKFGEIELADCMLELIKKNKYKDTSFSSSLEEVCESFVIEFEDIHSFDEDWDDRDEHDKKVEIAGQASAMLLKWVKTITDKEQKARLNVTLIDYV